MAKKEKKPKNKHNKKPSKTPVIRAEDLPSFRMYRDEYPKIDDLVVAEVTRIEDTGIYLRLLEYHDLEGLMMLSELSKRRWRTVSKMVQVARQEVVMVMRVDREKGYVDLSKKRVPPSDRERFLERFKSSRKVHSILRQVCARCAFSIKEAYSSFGWQLYDDFPHALDGLSLLNAAPKSFFEKYAVPEEIKCELQEVVGRRLTKKVRKVRAIFEINCFTFEGVESLRAALQRGEALSTAEAPLKVRLISSPRYSVTCQAKNPELAVERVEEALRAIEQHAKELRGHVAVTESPALENLNEDSEEDEDYDEGE